ncbi:flagellar hook-basal body complex protein [Yersinia pseudotuberculosis]|nr:flagellin [Yersinia pseudotuberculosis]MBO1567741.1 flagellar hook-basal body complex protein [Yersinia pseudotuberculosis]MBO1604600.1 flagellar hook-basal body complex protein [Yersinia pseudotuberculosis]
MSFSIANTALNAHTEQLNTISNNIANSATKGFKASRTEFSSMYAQSQPLGVAVSGVSQNISKDGQKEKTGMGLDLAISGGGFFVVRESSGDKAYNAEKLFAAGGKMRKELNFQSGTDANSSLKLDLNKVIEELTESVTEERKKVTGTSASATGSLEKQAFDLNEATTKANTALKEAEILQEKITTNLTKAFPASVDIPGYINAKGVPVAHEIIPSGTPINTGHIGKIQTAVAALRATYDAAAKTEDEFQAEHSTGGGVMNLLLRNKDRAMEADKKLSDVIDAYGAFRATLGANQNRLQSSSNNLDNMISNTAQALGSIKDTDFADEMKNHAQSEMLMQSSVMMLKKANAATQLISTLLQG